MPLFQLQFWLWKTKNFNDRHTNTLQSENKLEISILTISLIDKLWNNSLYNKWLSSVIITSLTKPELIIKIQTLWLAVN